MENKKCLVCRTSTLSPFGDIRELCKFPGSNGFRFLNNQLWAMFVLKKLLQCPQSKCEELMGKFNGRRHPSSWFVICQNCSPGLEEAWSIHQEISRLELKLKVIGNKFRDTIQQKSAEFNYLQNNLDTFEKQILQTILEEIPPVVVKREIFSPFREEETAIDENANWTRDLTSSMVDCWGTNLEIKSENESDEDDSNDKNWTPSAEKSSMSKAVTGKVKILRSSKRTTTGIKMWSKASVKKAAESLRQNKGRNTVKRQVGGACKNPLQAIHAFKCIKCPTSFRKSCELNAHLKAHETSNEMGNTFDCKECNYPCESERHLRHHTSHRHELTKYACDECGYTAPGKLRLARHKKIHSFMVAPKTYKCDVCEKSFDNYLSFTRHRRLSHAVELKLNIFKCELCESIYTTNKMLLDHIMHVHEKKSKHCCEICGKGLMSKKNLKTHMETHEVKTRSEICWVCGVDFLNERSLKDHVRKFHSQSKSETNKTANEVEYKCRYCDFKSPFRSVIMRHRKDHSDVYRHLCDICGNEYTKIFSLKLHKQIAHGDGKNVVQCEWCRKSFVHNHYLRNHTGRCKMRPAAVKEKELLQKPKKIRKASLLVINTVEKSQKQDLQPVSSDSVNESQPPKNVLTPIENSSGDAQVDPSDQHNILLCKYCRLFRADTKGQMYSHCIKMHKDEMNFNYKCDECDMKYTRESSLKRHKEVIHPADDIGMLPCRFCKKFFRHWSHLQSHYKICKVRPADEPIPTDFRPPYVRKRSPKASNPDAKTKCSRGRGRPKKNDIAPPPTNAVESEQNLISPSVDSSSFGSHPVVGLAANYNGTPELYHQQTMPASTNLQVFPVYTIMEEGRTQHSNMSTINVPYSQNFQIIFAQPYDQR